MNGTKQARIQCCNRCGHRVQCNEQRSGPHGFAVFCAALNGPLQELHDDYMEGPESNCPAGKWADLEPIGPTDPDEWRKWSQDREHANAVERQRGTLKPALKRALDGQPIEDVDDCLEDLVRRGDVLPEIAAEIGDELEAEATTTAPV